MKIFDIEYRRLYVQLLPTRWRKPRLMALLYVLVYPVMHLHYCFIRNRERILDQIQRNGQVCNLRGVLNDALDPQARRIEVLDASANGVWQIARSEEQTEHLLATDAMRVYNEEKILVSTSFFVVSVFWGADDKDKTYQLKSMLNDYKLVSKQYSITYDNQAEELRRKLYT
jgi:hypothetical protein